MFTYSHIFTPIIDHWNVSCNTLLKKKTARAVDRARRQKKLGFSGSPELNYDIARTRSASQITLNGTYAFGQKSTLKTRRAHELSHSREVTSFTILKCRRVVIIIHTLAALYRRTNIRKLCILVYLCAQLYTARVKTRRSNFQRPRS